MAGPTSGPGDSGPTAKGGGEEGQPSARITEHRNSGSGSLQEALLHPANRPVELIPALAAQVNPGANLNGLKDGKGLILDFRPGMDEHRPSLSYAMGDDGPVFTRFGGDGFEGGAVDFTANVLNISKQEAAAYLIERAGLPTSNNSRPRPKGGRRGRAPARRENRTANASNIRPLSSQDLERALRGWARLQEGDEGPEAHDVRRRGLWSALQRGDLVAYRWTGKDAESGEPLRLHPRLCPGAWAFVVPGPDGQPHHLKARNTALPLPEGTDRYVYLVSGHGAPAACPPTLATARREIFVEGELNGFALMEALREASHIAIQGIAGHGAQPHTEHLRDHPRDIYVYADRGEKGAAEAQRRWAQAAQQHGCRVHHLPDDLFPEGDACDALAAVGPVALRERLLSAMGRAQPTQVTQVWVDDNQGYGIERGRLVAYRRKRDGNDTWVETEVLTEFVARITAEITSDDGDGGIIRQFAIEARAANGKVLTTQDNRVTPGAFHAMEWTGQMFGLDAIVHAGRGRQERAAVAIQLLSQANGVQQRATYRHTGWRETPEHGLVYLSAGAVIGAQGAVPGVEVELSNRVADYVLPEPPEAEALKRAVAASLALLDLAPDPVAVPVLGALYRSPLGRLDSTVQVVGDTGRFKTSFLALSMAHFGARFSRHYLPEGWGSTLNALEKTAYAVKDGLFVIDDYKPQGDTRQRADMRHKISRIVQGVADGVGRTTLTADRQFRPNTHPRGLILLSAEEVVEGESNQARCLIVPVAESLHGPNLERRPAYNAAERLAREGVYAGAMAGYVQYLAQHSEELLVGSERHRHHIQQYEARFAGHHPRTGPACAELSFGWAAFLRFAVERGAITESDSKVLWLRVLAGLQAVAGQQGAYQEAQNPVARTLDLINSLLLQRRIHLLDKETGECPMDHADQVGWERHLTGANRDGEPQYTYSRPPGSVMVGWIGEEGGRTWVYFLHHALYEQLQMVSGRQHQGLPTLTTLCTQLRDRLEPQALMRCDREKRDGRVIHRTTHKISTPAGGRQQPVLTLAFPLGGEVQDSGKDGMGGIELEEKPLQTNETAIPPHSSLAEPGGRGGMEGEEQEGQSAPAGYSVVI